MEWRDRFANIYALTLDDDPETPRLFLSMQGLSMFQLGQPPRQLHPMLLGSTEWAISSHRYWQQAIYINSNCLTRYPLDTLPASETVFCPPQGYQMRFFTFSSDGSVYLYGYYFRDNSDPSLIRYHISRWQNGHWETLWTTQPVPLNPGDSPELVSSEARSEDESSVLRLWQPEGLEQDRQGNLYLRDRLGDQTLIRQITPRGQSCVLVSTKEAPWPGEQNAISSLSRLDPGSRDTVREFVIDRARDWLYILSGSLYRLDLRQHTLERLADPYDLQGLIGWNLSIDQQGHLYFTESSLEYSRIYQLQVPQPSGRGAELSPDRILGCP